MIIRGVRRTQGFGARSGGVSTLRRLCRVHLRVNLGFRKVTESGFRSHKTRGAGGGTGWGLGSTVVQETQVEVYSRLPSVRSSCNDVARVWSWREGLVECRIGPRAVGVLPGKRGLRSPEGVGEFEGVGGGGEDGDGKD